VLKLTRSQDIDQTAVAEPELNEDNMNNVKNGRSRTFSN